MTFKRDEMMKSTFCNPLDLSYRYQHFIMGDRKFALREGADPTLVMFKDVYYLFVSMSAGFWYSKDLLNWSFHENRNLPIYDYAPDARVIGDYLYFCASRNGEDCPILRTTDPLSDVFEEVSRPFPFYDPNLFVDDDGRVYLFWGCSNMNPIYGVEMDAKTFLPIGETVGLVHGDDSALGFERAGENGVVKEEGILFDLAKTFRNPKTGKVELPDDLPLPDGVSIDMIRSVVDYVGKPYIEGAFLTKHAGLYYLEYSAPGTEFNTYCNGVYVSEHPLGPYRLQPHNPYSSKPGGFITGAGHGSTIEDRNGNYWHIATMRISINHNFERRVGLFPAGFDSDGNLFCNQNFGDYPCRIPSGRFDPWSVKPEWMLLSYKKTAHASSTADGSDPGLALNEDIRSWWSAGRAEPGEWLCVDLGKVCDVRAVQVNMADEAVQVDIHPDKYYDERMDLRDIEENCVSTHYTLRASVDGQEWQILDQIERECSNVYHEIEAGIRARYIQIVGGELPYGQTLRISGLRVFGNGDGELPKKANAVAIRVSDLDGLVKWDAISDVQGCNVRYGIDSDKLYCSWMVYDANEVKLSTLMKGREYYVRVDAFNENGITEGDIVKMES